MPITPEEAANRRNIRDVQKAIDTEYQRAISEVFTFGANLKFVNETFKASENPIFIRKLNEAMKKFRVNVEASIINGISNSFAISQQNFSNLIYGQYDGRTITPEIKRILNATYEGPLQAFLDRSTNGIKLSERVWNLARQFQSEIEYTVFTGLSQGQSAADMARSLKGYLKNPDKLFRRVRNATGKLVLSNPAKAFKPGQGVYRSSYKNAFRTSRVEINTAYRTADHNKFKSIPFVLGIEIRLSDAHEIFDMCDYLVGIYPVWFKFTGWHIQCICYMVPVLPTKEQFRAYQQSLLDETDYVFEGKVNEVPKKAFDWIADNAKRLKALKTLPTFMLDNREVFKVE